MAERAGTHSHHTALHHLYVSSCVTNSTSYIDITNSHTDGGTRWYTFSSYCFTLRRAATHRSTLHRAAPHCTTLQHTTPHCNTPHHTAMQRISETSIARVEILERQLATEFTVYNHCEADFWELQTSKQLLFGFEAMEFMKVNTTFRCVGVDLRVSWCLSWS